MSETPDVATPGSEELRLVRKRIETDEAQPPSPAELVVAGAAAGAPVRESLRAFALGKMWQDDGADVPKRWNIKAHHARNYYRVRLAVFLSSDCDAWTPATPAAGAEDLAAILRAREIEWQRQIDETQTAELAKLPRAMRRAYAARGLS